MLGQICHSGILKVPQVHSLLSPPDNTRCYPATETRSVLAVYAGLYLIFNGRGGPALLTWFNGTETHNLSMWVLLYRGGKSSL